MYHACVCKTRGLLHKTLTTDKTQGKYENSSKHNFTIDFTIGEKNSGFEFFSGKSFMQWAPGLVTLVQQVFLYIYAFKVHTWKISSFAKLKCKWGNYAVVTKLCIFTKYEIYIQKDNTYKYFVLKHKIVSQVTFWPSFVTSNTWREEKASN